MVFGMNKLSRRTASMRKGLVAEYDPDEDPDYRDGETQKWETKTERYKGMLVGQFKSEEVVGSIKEGIETMKKQPAKYLAIKYATEHLDLPETEQAFTFIYRKDVFQCAPMDPDPDGAFTLVSMLYERLPKYKDDVLPKSHRDKYTDSMVWKGKKLHTAKNKPLLPGRGMGIVDKPCLKVIGDVDPTDVKQGLIGDCWMLSGISTLSEYDGSIRRLFRNTKNIEQMPFDTKANMYSVTLYDTKTWKETDVVVDERLCLRPDWKTRSGHQKLLGARPSKDGQLWVPYLEKAITIHCGGFDQVNYGANSNHAWAVLTGVKEQCTIMRKGDETTNWGCYGRYNTRDKKWEEWDNDPWKGSQTVYTVPWPEPGGGTFDNWTDYDECTDDQLFQKMSVWDDNNFLQAASSKGESDQNKTDGIIDNHAYGIVDCRLNVADSGVDMIQLRNPWGYDGALENGTFVKDKGAGWEKHPKIKEELEPELDDPGVFWLTKEEFFQYYGTFYLSGQDMSEFLGFSAADAKKATEDKKRKAAEDAIENEKQAKRREEEASGSAAVAVGGVAGDVTGDVATGADAAIGDVEEAGTNAVAAGEVTGDAVTGVDAGPSLGDDDDASGGAVTGVDAGPSLGDDDEAGGGAVTGAADGGDTGAGGSSQAQPYVVNPKVAAKERRRRMNQCILAVFCLAALGAGLPFFIPFVLDLPTILGGDETRIVAAADPTSAPTVVTPPPTTLSPTVSPAPTLSPTISPAPTITANPTVATPSPTISPSVDPSEKPTSAPTTLAPTGAPTTLSPTRTPTGSPTRLPTVGLPPPTLNPTVAPTRNPTVAPTTKSPTKLPTVSPTRNPTKTPTAFPTRTPSITPSRTPTATPTTSPPTKSPTVAPTKTPSATPTKNPTASPTTSPPTKAPTGSPTKSPTRAPTKSPTASPTTSPPTKAPTGSPTKSPTRAPTPAPTRAPTPAPTKGQIEVQLESISGVGVFDNPRSPQSIARNVLLREGLGDQGQFDDKALERYAAAVFYFGTGGDDFWYQCFRGHTNCGSGQWFNGDVCSWNFVSCNGSGFITSIVINSDNGLRGSIPMEIWSLDSLEVLEIVDNPAMSGSLPIKFGERATNMVLLRIENSGLTGTIPNGFLANSPVEFLYLSRNRLSGQIPNSFGLLTSLNELTLQRNDLTGAVPPTVCTLRGTGSSDLQVLMVDCNEVSCSCCTASTSCPASN